MKFKIFTTTTTSEYFIQEWVNRTVMDQHKNQKYLYQGCRSTVKRLESVCIILSNTLITLEIGI